MYSKYLLLILNCRKYSEKRKRQLEGWLKEFPMEYYHVIGDESVDKYKFDEDNRVLYVECKDDYMSLCHKTCMMVRAVYESKPEIEYILKTDDDMDCCMNRFDEIIGVMKGYDYGGFMINVPEGVYSKYHTLRDDVENKDYIKLYGCEYCNGRFYFLSRISMELIVGNEWIMKSSVYEDNAVGYVLSKYKIRKIGIPDKYLFSEWEE